MSRSYTTFQMLPNNNFVFLENPNNNFEGKATSDYTNQNSNPFNTFIKSKTWTMWVFPTTNAPLTVPSPYFRQKKIKSNGDASTITCVHSHRNQSQVYSEYTSGDDYRTSSFTFHRRFFMVLEIGNVRSPMTLLGTMLTLPHNSDQNAREGRVFQEKVRPSGQKTKCDQILTRQGFFDKAHLVACSLEGHHFVRWFNPNVSLLNTLTSSSVLCLLLLTT